MVLCESDKLRHVYTCMHVSLGNTTCFFILFDIHFIQDDICNIIENAYRVTVLKQKMHT